MGDYHEDAAAARAAQLYRPGAAGLTVNGDAASAGGGGGGGGSSRSIRSGGGGGGSTSDTDALLGGGGGGGGGGSDRASVGGASSQGGSSFQLRQSAEHRRRLYETLQQRSGNEMDLLAAEPEHLRERRSQQRPGSRIGEDAEILPSELFVRGWGGSTASADDLGSLGGRPRGGSLRSFGGSRLAGGGAGAGMMDGSDDAHGMGPRIDSSSSLPASAMAAARARAELHGHSLDRVPLLPGDELGEEYEEIEELDGNGVLRKYKVLRPEYAEDGGPVEYQSSIATIFSIANTMLGSSLLALPWGFTNSGLAAGLGTVVIVGAICVYTALLVVNNAGGEEDFSEVCRAVFGRPGLYASVIVSVLVLVGAAIAYNIIMATSLFKFVEGARQFAQGEGHHHSWTWWTTHTSPLFLMVILFPTVNLKDFSVLVKLNMLGVASVLYLICFIPAQSITANAPIQFKEAKEFDHRFFYLAGMLTLAFFIHNCLINILKKNNPKYNTRDTLIAYCIVGFCYASVGAGGYLGYGQALTKYQDFLEALATTNVFAMIARIMVVVQLFSVYPLLLFIIRIQLFGAILKKQYPGFWWVLGLNTLIAGTTTLFAMYYPKIGDVLRFTGAVCGMVYVFILPIGVHWSHQRDAGTLTWGSKIGHSLLLLIGAALVISQFIPGSA